MAELIGVEPHVLRFWETEFAQITPSKSKTQQRLYKRDDVETILLIRDLLYTQKFTIEGAKNRLRELKSKAKDLKKASQITFGFEPAATTIERTNPSDSAKPLLSDKAVLGIKKVIQDMDDFLED